MYVQFSIMNKYCLTSAKSCLNRRNEATHISQSSRWPTGQMDFSLNCFPALKFQQECLFYFMLFFFVLCVCLFFCYMPMVVHILFCFSWKLFVLLDWWLYNLLVWTKDVDVQNRQCRVLATQRLYFHTRFSLGAVSLQLQGLSWAQFCNILMLKQKTSPMKWTNHVDICKLALNWRQTNFYL